MVDSSPMYGRAEEVVGDLTVELAFVKSAIPGYQTMDQRARRGGAADEEESFRLLPDHRPHADPQPGGLEDSHRHPQARKEQGRVRYIGITHYHEGAYDEMERLIKTRQYDFVQLNYSIAEREAEKSVLPLAQETGVAVIANRPFAKASLFSRVRGKQVPDWARDFDCSSWAQFFLKYIVSHPAVSCAIPATSTPNT